MKNILRKEHGSITLFVLVAMIFMTMFLATIYTLSTNNEIATRNANSKLKEKYEIGLDRIDEIYYQLLNVKAYDKYGNEIANFLENWKYDDYKGLLAIHYIGTIDGETGKIEGEVPYFIRVGETERFVESYSIYKTNENGEYLNSSGNVTTKPSEYVTLGLFEDVTDISTITKLDVSNFDTSKITTMTSMFKGFNALAELVGVSNFDTSKVTAMNSMFQGCKTLAQIDVSNFNTSNVTDMQYMFSGCAALTELDVRNWNTAKVGTDAEGKGSMKYMFSECSSLTNYNEAGELVFDVSNWDTSNVTAMNSMFSGCKGLKILNVNNWNTSKVKNMAITFERCSGLETLDVSNWDTTNVTNMTYMFSSCSGLTELKINGHNFNTKNVTNMAYMFYGCSGLTELDVTGFETDSLEMTKHMFENCSNLTSLDLSSFTGGKMKEMHYMFTSCLKIETILLPDNFVTSSATEIHNMFKQCNALTTLNNNNNLNTWDLSNTNLTDLSYMFNGCARLVTLNISDWNTSNITTMYGTFWGSRNIKELDLSGWDTSNVTNMANMFNRSFSYRNTNFRKQV